MHGAKLAARVDELLDAVRLDTVSRYPHELSGASGNEPASPERSRSGPTC